MIRAQVRGEMTVFLSLTLMLIAALLFTLVEGARFKCLRSMADMDRVMEAQSAFAEYDVMLLKEYGLLFLDDSYGTGTENVKRIAERIMTLSEANLNPDLTFGSDLLRMRMVDCSVDCYELATDYGGEAFRKQVVEYVKENLGSIAIDAFERRIKEGESGTTEPDTAGFDPSGTVSSGKQAVSDAKAAAQAAKEKGEELPDCGIPPATDYEDPLELFDMLSGSSPLVLVMPEGKEVSVKKADLSDSLLKRTLYTGNYPQKTGANYADTLFYMMYLNQQFGCCTKVKPGKRLDYELEYILCGHDSDRENLEAVVRRILLIREMTNWLYLQTDAEKKAIADSIAVAIAGATLSPELIPVIRQAILVAWSLVESLMEIRTLLSGGRVAVVKTAADWKTDVLHAATSFHKGEGTGSKSKGFSYSDYLFQFLMLENRTTLNMRTMDMMEQNIRMKQGTNAFRMDCMIQKMNLSYLYEARPLFLSFVTIGDIDRGNYRFDQEYKISYLLQ